MTVSSNINLFTSNETANGDAVNLGGSPVQVTEVFIEGTAALGDRVTSTAGLSGFVCIDDGGVTQDMSAAGTHVGIWLWVTVYSILNQLQVVLSNSTTTSGGGAAAANYGGMNLTPSTDYPKLGGWYRIWADTSLFNSPDSTVGSWTSGDISTVGAVGAIVEFLSTPGGSTENVIIDAIHYTNGSSPTLVATGAGNDFDTFADFDDVVTPAGTGQQGVFKLISGTYQCLGRIQLSDTASTTFSDSNFNINFPNQPLVADNYMGINIDLTNSGTSISLTNGAIQSVGTKQGDLIVNGTTSTNCTFTDCSFLDLRQITLTSSVEVSGGVIRTSDITQGGAYIHDGVIRTQSTSGVAVIDDPTFGTTSGLSNVEFIQAGTGHAIEITSPGTYTFTDLTFSGYSGTTGSNLTPASGDNAAAILNSSGGLVTIDVSGGNVMSVRNTTGSTTQVNKKFNLKMTRLHAGTELRIFTQSGLVEQGGGVENVETAGSYGTDFTQVAGENPDANGLYSVNYEYNYSTDTDVYVVAHNVDYIYRRIDTTLIEADATLQIDQSPDRQYI